MTEFEEQVRTVLYDTFAQSLGIDKSILTDDTEPEKDLGAKSVNIVNVVNALEDEFGYQVNYMPFRRRKTLGGMVEYMNELEEG